MSNDFFYSKDNTVSGSPKSAMVKERLTLISSHMIKQLKAFELSTENTKDVFNTMAEEMDNVVNMLQGIFAEKGVNTNSINYTVVPEKSLIVLNILWHNISFTIHGNSKPQALYRSDDAPMFSGRIIALNGDLKDAEQADILISEIASLYIPAEKTAQTIMKIKHLGNVEYKISQCDCAREFLLKTVEIICGGGFYHEEHFNV